MLYVNVKAYFNPYRKWYVICSSEDTPCMELQENDIICFDRRDDISICGCNSFKGRSFYEYIEPNEKDFTTTIVKLKVTQRLRTSSGRELCTLSTENCQEWCFNKGLQNSWIKLLYNPDKSIDIVASRNVHILSEWSVSHFHCIEDAIYFKDLENYRYVEKVGSDNVFIQENKSIPICKLRLRSSRPRSWGLGMYLRAGDVIGTLIPL